MFRKYFKEIIHSMDDSDSSNNNNCTQPYLNRKGFRIIQRCALRVTWQGMPFCAILTFNKFYKGDLH